jgi:O-succinylhomoserine sulfhydrylase
MGSTVDTFQKRLAVMEQGERCLAFASGMAAIMAVGIAQF